MPLHVLAAYIMARLGLGGLFVGAAFHAVGAGLTAAGVWMLTTPEVHQPHRWLALAARGFSVASALLWVLATVTAWHAGILPWIIAPALACMAAIALTLGLYAGKLAARMPGDELVFQFRHFVTLLPLFFAFLIFCQFHDLKFFFDHYFFFAFPLVGALLGIAVWTAVTLVRFSLALRGTLVADLAPWQLEAAAGAAAPTPVDSTWTPDEIRDLLEPLLHCWLMIGLGLMLVGAAIRDYRYLQVWDFLRVHFIVAEIIAGVGIAFCFGGAMHYLDLVLAYRRATGAKLAWYWRVLLVLQKRLLMIFQLAAAALVIGLIGLIIFDVPIPGLGM